MFSEDWKVLVLVPVPTGIYKVGTGTGTLQN
jgi:hypothetical protein